MVKKKSEAFEKQNLVILILLIVFFILTISLYFVFKITSLDYSSPDTNDSKIIVSEVIDGDTFKLSSGETVRLICVDAPEKNTKGYEEAKKFLSDLILNKEVRLEKDVSEIDAYGRLLRYVYLNESGEDIFVNKEIVRAGYGEPWPYGNDTAKCGEIGYN